MPTVVGAITSLAGTVKGAFISVLGANVGGAVFSALTKYVISSAISSLTQRGRSRSQQEREINHRGGDREEEVLIGESRQGNVTFMYESATVGGTKYIYHGVLLPCFHQIEEITKIYIGDKDENHPDFSDVELAKYEFVVDGSYLACTGGAGVPAGCTEDPAGLITLTFDGNDYTHTPNGSTDTAQVIRDALFSLLPSHDEIKITTFDRGDGGDPEEFEYGIRFVRNTGTAIAWDIDLSVTNTNGHITTAVTKTAGHAKTKDYIRVTRFLGDQTEANPLILSELKDNPTLLRPFDETHIGYERAGWFLRIEAEWLRVNYGAVPPSIADIKGHNKLTDMRDGVEKYSTNPAVVAYNALLDDDIYRADVGDLNAEVFKAEANICDEQIQIDEVGNTQNRYEFNGSYSYGWQTVDILSLIARSCDGQFVERGFETLFYVGAQRMPVYHITQDDIEGGFTYNPVVSNREVSNIALGTYIEKTQNYAQTTYPAIIINDGNKRKTLNINFEHEINAKRAQRLAYIALTKQITSTPYSLTLKPLDLEQDHLITVGSFVTTENDYLGIDDSILWVVAERKYQGTDGASNLILKRVHDTVYEWDYTQASDVNEAIPVPLTIERDELLEGIEI